MIRCLSIVSRNNFLQTIIGKYTLLSIKIVTVILLVWLVQVLFLSEAAKWGMNGGDDWDMLFYYDAHKGNELSNLFNNVKNTGTPYLWTEIYYIGPLRDIFGLNQTVFKLIEMLFKSLASLSAGFLVFKLTRDKLFAFLVILFFIIFPSTAGVLSHIVLSGGFLTVGFMCFFVFFYIQSVKQRKKIFLASPFFFLALVACPPRAYLILPVPFIVELVRLRKTLNPFLFLQRMLIFYLSLVFLQSGPGWFNPTGYILFRIKQLTSGNLYTITLPFQMVSTLFVDQHILKDALGDILLPSINPNLTKILIINLVLFTLSFFFGFVFKKTKKWFFSAKLMILTLVLEVIFYLLGFFSPHITATDCTNCVPFKDPQGFAYWLAPFNLTFLQASIGGYFFILGLILALEWWKYQRDNKILMITVFSWLWVISSEVFLYLTNSWWNMVTESNDKYILVCSLGAVIFSAGIFTLSFKALSKMKQFRLLSIPLLVLVLLMISYKDYMYLNRFYYNWNEGEGGSSYWQDSMYQRFLEKFGKNNLNKPAFLYIDNGKYIESKTKSMLFNQGSFANPILRRIYYDEKGQMIRDNCKVVTTDIEVVKKAYAIQNEEKGFLFDSECIDPGISTKGQIVFYPLSNFYAYRIENKEFVEIKDKVINQLNQQK